jgi:hypothetical protein
VRLSRVVGIFINVGEHRELQESTELLLTRQPQRLWTSRMQLGAGLRVASREQRHVMAAVYEFLGDVGNDAFGAAVELGRDTLVQWSNLCDTQGTHPAFRGRFSSRVGNTQMLAP